MKLMDDLKHFYTSEKLAKALWATGLVTERELGQEPKQMVFHFELL